jgi:hypothetical protein
MLFTQPSHTSDIDSEPENRMCLTIKVFGQAEHALAAVHLTAVGVWYSRSQSELEARPTFPSKRIRAAW